MNIEEKFNEFYNKFLIENQNNFDDIESLRKNSVNERKRNKFLITISVITFFLLSIATMFFSNDENKETVEAFGILFMNMTWIAPMIIALKKRKNLNEYDKIYKEKIIKSLIKSFCPSLEYSPNGTIEYEDFKKIDSEHCNCFLSSNLIKGSYQYDEITIAKVLTQYNYSEYRDGRRRNSSYETFDGVFAKIKLSDSFNKEIFIKQKEKISEKLFNVFLADISQVNKSKREENFFKNNYNKISINKLNDLFNIYSSDIHVDKTILDLKTTEILLDIYNNEKFEIAIIGNCIYIKLWISGLFSNPPLEKETYDKEIIFKNYRILYIIFYLTSKLKEKL